MNAETGCAIGVAVFLYLTGMLQTVNAIRFYSNSSYFNECIVGPLLGAVLWPIVAIALWFMYRRELRIRGVRKERSL